MYYQYYHSPIGTLTIVESNQQISHLLFGKQDKADYVEQSTALLQLVIRQLEEYFAKKRSTFELPLAPEGTIFRKRVWEALTTIPYGSTASYKAIAVAIGNEQASRAVGHANNQNPLPIFIPCHRVIGANGALVGYGGGLAAKEFLLRLEGVL